MAFERFSHLFLAASIDKLYFCRQRRYVHIFRLSCIFMSQHFVRKKCHYRTCKLENIV